MNRSAGRGRPGRRPACRPGGCLGWSADGRGQMWAGCRSSQFSVRFSSSRLWNLGTVAVRPGQCPPGLSTSCRGRAGTPGTGRGRRVGVHPVVPRRARTTRPGSTPLPGLSTALHRQVHSLCPDGQGTGARLCPQTCPHAVYEAWLIRCLAPARGVLVTQSHVCSPGGRRGPSDRCATGPVPAAPNLNRRERAGRGHGRRGTATEPAEGRRMRCVNGVRTRHERRTTGEQRAGGGPAGPHDEVGVDGRRQPRAVCLMRLVSSVTWL